MVNDYLSCHLLVLHYNHRLLFSAFLCFIQVVSFQQLKHTHCFLPWSSLYTVSDMLSGNLSWVSSLYSNVIFLDRIWLTSSSPLFPFLSHCGRLVLSYSSLKLNHELLTCLSNALDVICATHRIKELLKESLNHARGVRETP